MRQVNLDEIEPEEKLSSQGYPFESRELKYELGRTPCFALTAPPAC